MQIFRSSIRIYFAVTIAFHTSSNPEFNLKLTGKPIRAKFSRLSASLPPEIGKKERERIRMSPGMIQIQLGWLTRRISCHNKAEEVQLRPGEITIKSDGSVTTLIRGPRVLNVKTRRRRRKSRKRRTQRRQAEGRNERKWIVSASTNLPGTRGDKLSIAVTW